MDEDLRRAKLHAIHNLTNTLISLGLMDFGNLWEWELELFEYWKVTGSETDSI